MAAPSDVISRLFHDYDHGRLSRRHLLQAIGVAMAMRPAAALAQGSCGGARASLPECDPTPAKAPFASTGWKTVLLDNFTVEVADYEKEAAYYQALMNWKIRSNDGKQAVLDIGDWGGLIIKGGYTAPPPAPRAGGDAAAAGAPPAGATTAGADGQARAGGRGGGGGQRIARNVQFTSFCWGIEPWNAKTVEAELKKRGLNPVADNNGKGFESFWVKDADGFNLQISNGNRKNRRQGAATGKVSAPAPFDSTTWKTLWLDHISFETSNYKEQAAFYNALLGWKLGVDEGSQNECNIGNVGGIIIRRGGGAGRGGGANPGDAPAPRRAQIGHISFGISGFEPDAVKAELDKRGLTGRADTGATGDIHEAKYKSYHTTTPNGFDLQISNKTAFEQ